MNHPGILFKCRFWFGPSGVGWRLCIPNQLPGRADAAERGTNCGLQKPRPLSDKVLCSDLGIKTQRLHNCVVLKPVSQKLPKAKTKVCLRSDKTVDPNTRSDKWWSGSQGLQGLRQFLEAHRSQHWNIWEVLPQHRLPRFKHQLLTSLLLLP